MFFIGQVTFIYIPKKIFAQMHTERYKRKEAVSKASNLVILNLFQNLLV